MLCISIPAAIIIIMQSASALKCLACGSDDNNNMTKEKSIETCKIEIKLVCTVYSFVWSICKFHGSIICLFKSAVKLLSPFFTTYSLTLSLFILFCFDVIDKEKFRMVDSHCDNFA